MKKKIAIMILTVCVFVGNLNVYAENVTEQTETIEQTDTELTAENVEHEETQMNHPTGLIQMQEINVGEIDEEDIYIPTEEYSDDLKNLLLSSAYASEWDSYSNNYFYNQMSDAQRELWDALDTACLSVLLNTANIEDNTLPYVYYTGLSENEAKYVAYIFRYSNPQYYFLNTTVGYGYYGDNHFISLGIYPAFANGSQRQTATKQVKNQIDSWISMVSSYATDAEKVKALHNLIVEKVEYNNDIYSSNFNENTAFSQTAYSVFCMDKTVCAGYAQAFEVMCNAVGIDCIAVTSSDHEWNKVRINDSWYNVDCTWADQSDSINYYYFERSDAVYDSDAAYYASSHRESGFWNGYLPNCTLDSGATYTDPGSPQIASVTTQSPVIKNNQQQITITCGTPGAIIYYTLNGDTPSPSKTKSYRYTGTFTLNDSANIKAIAVCDTYWDSQITQANEQIVSYTLSYDGNGADSGSVSSVKFVPGATVQLAPATSFSKKGYTFISWNTRADGSGTSYNAGASVNASWTSNVTLYAQWACDTVSDRVSGKDRFVALLYENALDRYATRSELDYWVNRLENGSTGADVAYGFLFSQEFINKNYNDSDYVEHLYLSLMGRASDSDGKNDWVTHLKNGVSRKYVFKQFINSNEFANLCSTYQINKGEVKLEEARDQNYNVTRFVVRNYKQFLGRDYDVNGLNDWTGRINSGYGLDQVAYGFVFSAECKNMNLSNEDFVKILYRGIFDREADQTGLSDWTGRLNSGATREDVFWGFANSQEFSNLVASYGL